MDLELIKKFALYFVVFFGVGLLWFFYDRKQKGQSEGGGKTPSNLKNLTELAKAGKLDAVVGRDEEIERLIHIISRRSKNNPLLIGEPGVGKTAIVEGFARRIVDREVPNALRGKQILELNVSELISGTKFRGEFEERLRNVIKELEKMPRQAILFIDEIHVIEQTKGTEGAMSASDILKPALARGDLSIIGATTFKEYEEFIRPNPALDRRFQPLLVSEPTPEQALAVLRGVAKLYEQHHDVTIDDGALQAAVELSSQLLPDRFLPDKAIDILDEAAAKVAIESSGIHRKQIGLVHAAAEKARERVALEQRKLDAELGHLEGLNKEFPGDPAITSAEATLKRHTKELEAVVHAATDDARPRVMRTDVEEVAKAWRELGKSEGKGKSRGK